jgi:hypothetical protein
LALVLAAWLGVVIAHAVRLARSFRTLRGIVARAVPVAAHADVTRLAGQIGLAAAPEIRVSDEIDGPQVAGVRRPVVLLPAALTALQPEAWRLALAHELMHVRRGDLALGWIPAIAERLFFFHPLARVAAREYFTAREAACDAAVVRALDVQPAAYGRLLVQLGVARADAALSASASSSSASSLRRRLEMLQHAASTPLPRSPRVLILLLAAAMLPFELVGRAAPAQLPAVAAPPADEAPSVVAPALPAQRAVTVAPSRPAAPARVRTLERPVPVTAASVSPTPAPAVPAVAAPAAPVSAVAVPAPVRVRPSPGARPVAVARAQEPAPAEVQRTQEGAAAILEALAARRAQIEAERSGQLEAQRAQIEELRRALADAERSAADALRAQASELERVQAEAALALKLEAGLAQTAAPRTQQEAERRKVKPNGVAVGKAGAASASSTAALTRQIQTLTRQQQSLIEQQQNLARQQERITEQQRRLAEETERLRQAIERMVEVRQPPGQ